MSLISIQFALFVGLAALVYFLFPRKYRWTVLLVAGYAYYLLICNKYIVYMMVTTVTTWLGGLKIGSLYEQQKATVKEHKQDWDRQTRKAYKEKMLGRCRWVMILVLILNFGILGFLKYSGFAAQIIEGFTGLFGSHIHLPMPAFILPLGISFYTFQSMGYIIDVYQEKVEPEKNLARFALFVSFFPQIIQGPIAMYDDLAHQLYEAHDFELDHLKNGCALILWGVFKKMIIADRAVKLINYITADSSQFTGTFILGTALLYALQLYADFSGGIDVVRGVAEIFGIHMAENFKRPYFSTSLTEYWHRWHMTLGNWVRNYVFYPLSISKTFLKMGKKISGVCGKHLGKVFPTSLASLITFLIIGIWHGANGKYVAFGLWNGIVIMLIEILRPWYERIWDALHINVKGIAFRLCAMVWTFILVLIGYYFDIAQNFTDACHMLIKSVTDLHLSDLHHLSVIKDGGLSKADCLAILVGACIMFAASVIQEKTGKNIREILWQHHIVIRWGILLAGILMVMVLGYYGPGMDPAEFVYMQF